MPRRPPRLIDLHANWLRQYAPETEIFGPPRPGGSKPILDPADGYLSTTSAAVIALSRDPEDWAHRADPWHSLGELVARVEAEFSGRILIGPDDVDRWHDDPDGMCWAVLGVKGLDALVRTRADLDRLPGLFARGVRVFQPVDGPGGLLGGAASGDPERGLTPLGHECLEAILGLGPTGPGPGPRPALDIARMNPLTVTEVLGWFEADPARSGRIILLSSHGTPEHTGFDSQEALRLDSLKRLRHLGGCVGITPGPPFHRGAAGFLEIMASTAALPFRDAPGYSGIAIATDLFGTGETLPGLGTAYEIRDWLLKALPPGVGQAVVHDNAASLLARLAGKE